MPCKVQSQKLAGLAIEADGAFRLARINCDEQTKLAEKLKVTSLPPHLKAFVDGRVVAEYTGGLSESSLRLFLDRILPHTGSLLLQKGKVCFCKAIIKALRSRLDNMLSSRMASRMAC